MTGEAENPSFRDERSTSPYNEDKVSSPEMLDWLREDHPEFCGDWSQLERLVENLDAVSQRGELPPEERLKEWNEWAQKADDRDEFIHLEGAYLLGARLEGADLVWAHLEGADLMEAHLEQARLTEAVLDEADVRRAMGLRFDENRVSRIHIEGNAPDPWSVLRRKYTGPWFFVHLLLLVAFFTPYVAKFLYLSSLSRAQDYVIERAEALEGQVGDFERRLLQIAEKHEAQFPWLRDLTTAAVERCEKTAQEMRSDLDRSYVQRRAVWVLLGWTDAWWVFAMALVVVLYNVLRGVLTLRVGALRDAEERSEITPRLKEYWPLYRMHCVTRALLLVAVAVTAFNLGRWAWQTNVYVPREVVAAAPASSGPSAASSPTEGGAPVGSEVPGEHE